MKAVFEADDRLRGENIAEAWGDLQGEVELRGAKLGSPVGRLWHREQDPGSPLQERDHTGAGSHIIVEEQVEPAAIDCLRILKGYERWHRFDDPLETSLHGRASRNLGEDIAQPWHEGDKVDPNLGRP